MAIQCGKCGGKRRPIRGWTKPGYLVLGLCEKCSRIKWNEVLGGPEGKLFKCKLVGSTFESAGASLFHTATFGVTRSTMSDAVGKISSDGCAFGYQDFHDSDNLLKVIARIPPGKIGRITYGTLTRSAQLKEAAAKSLITGGAVAIIFFFMALFGRSTYDDSLLSWVPFALIFGIVVFLVSLFFRALGTRGNLLRMDVWSGDAEAARPSISFAVKVSEKEEMTQAIKTEGFRVSS